MAWGDLLQQKQQAGIASGGTATYTSNCVAGSIGICFIRSSTAGTPTATGGGTWTLRSSVTGTSAQVSHVFTCESLTGGATTVTITLTGATTIDVTLGEYDNAATTTTFDVKAEAAAAGPSVADSGSVAATSADKAFMAGCVISTNDVSMSGTASWTTDSSWDTGNVGMSLCHKVVTPPSGSYNFDITETPLNWNAHIVILSGAADRSLRMMIRTLGQGRPPRAFRPGIAR